MGLVTENGTNAPGRKDASWLPLSHGVQINAAALTPPAERLLSPRLLKLLATCHRELQGGRLRLLANRALRQTRYDAGALPDFLAPAEHPGAHADWRIAPLPADLRKRRVEISGPISDAKTVIKMLSRNTDGFRADAAMLDFEDLMNPSWSNVVTGVDNLIGAVGGTLTFEKPSANGRPEKVYRIDSADMPLLMVRVRGLHLNESNLLVDGFPVSAGLFDLVVSACHTAYTLVRQGKTPKYYVPKVEHYEEAAWWNQLFRLVEESLRFPRGTLRATLLIETLPAAFQMEEILYEIREHAAGLNVGRWDKIFSDIKVLMNHPDRVLADRATISLHRSWMKDYALQLIRVCHRRGAHAIGGMSPIAPGRTETRREAQVRRITTDKKFEASMGHDGCCVSHPYFIGPALGAFPSANQLDVIPEIESKPAMVPLPEGPKTLAGLRTNIRAGIAYLRGWNAELGCVAWDDLVEDLATLEMSRAQVRQWMHNRITLDDGEQVTVDFVRSVFHEQQRRIEAEICKLLCNAGAGTIEREVQAYRDAAFDAEALFLETDFRPFLASSSPAAHLGPKERRQQLFGAGAA